MKNLKIVFNKLIILTVVIIISGCTASPEFGTYKMALNNQMQDMLNVLFAGHYNQFMSTYVNPASIKKMGGIDQALLQFDNTEQKRLYADLKICQNITPFYDENVNEMVYTTAGLMRPITFKQISGKWYMQGDWFNN